METVRYRFGLFEFDAANRELRREGVLVRLQAQPAQVLASLVERAGDVVSREELRAALWGSETYVDFDRGLNFCVSQLRAALRDPSAEPVYIRTVPKQGYQFIAPVARVPVIGLDPLLESAKLAAPISELAEAARLGRKISGRWIVGLTALALLLAAGAGAVWMRRPLDRLPSLDHPSILDRPPIVAVLRFDNETGDPAISAFSDDLTQTTVVELTSASRGRYEVIGNALVLQTPRDQRDPVAIAASLHATYLVLGQVQSNHGQLRVLAHLIRMPEQTHLWVVRADRSLGDPLAVQSEVAKQIGVEFSQKLFTKLASK
jgi:DNA-binding winged helix-turn-helix (wHTH) protein/TolB-like protein